MPISRRTTIKGLGVLLGGGGVEMMRSAANGPASRRAVTIEFVPDDAANLQIRPAPGVGDMYFAETAEGAVALSFTDINRSAVTTFANVFEFTNQSTNTITAIEAEAVGVSGNGDLTFGGIPDADIGPGESATGLSVTINTTDAEGFTGDPDIQGAVRITARTDA